MFPTQALAQYPNAEKNPAYSPNPALAYAYTPASSPGRRTASDWKTRASVSMPVPAISQATSAPSTPVSWANRPGSENTPAPTIEPTTSMVSVGSASFAAPASASRTAAPAAPAAPVSPVSSVATRAAPSRPRTRPPGRPARRRRGRNATNRAHLFTRYAPFPRAAPPAPPPPPPPQATPGRPRTGARSTAAPPPGTAVG